MDLLSSQNYLHQLRLHLSEHARANTHTMPKRDRGDELGRSLVQLLRHGAHEANVPIDDEGWVALDAALAHVNRRGKSFTVADVEQSVAACAKQRMALRTSPAGARQIRANQGHSMKDVHVEMKRLDAASAPEAECWEKSCVARGRKYYACNKRWRCNKFCISS